MKKTISFPWSLVIIISLSFSLSCYAWFGSQNIEYIYTTAAVAQWNKNSISTSAEVKLPRLENYPNKKIEKIVNDQIAKMEGDMGCFAGESLDELRDTLKFQRQNHSDSDLNGDSMSSRDAEVSTFNEQQLRTELLKYSDWNTDSKITKNSDDVFSINIHSGYFCGGAYPTNDANDSVTFDLKTGKIIPFKDLFVDLEKNMPKIISIAFAEEIQESASHNAVEGDCQWTLEAMLSEPYFNYSLEGKDIILQEDLPHVIEACSFEKKVPIAKLKAYIQPKGILARIISAN